jgi:hypothetical protein
MLTAGHQPANAVQSLAGSRPQGRGDPMRKPASQAVSPGDPGAAVVRAGDEPAVIALALQVGRIAVSSADVLEGISEVCRAIPHAVGVAGVAILVSGPPEVDVIASDPRVAWLGEIQRRAAVGPLDYALRSGRPMVTPDLTRVGPPGLAAAAAESGLFTSLVLPLVVEGRRLGALQLLGDAARPVGIRHVEILQPLVAALTARFADLLAFLELTRGAPVPEAPEELPRTRPRPHPGSAESIAPGDDPTEAIPVVRPSQFSPSPTPPSPVPIHEAGARAISWFSTPEPRTPEPRTPEPRTPEPRTPEPRAPGPQPDHAASVEPARTGGW